MLHILLFWARKGVDGFRCDMVDMVPIEFWEWVIPQVKEKYPNIIFIAETYKPELFKPYVEKKCFDFLYDKVITYETIRNILQYDENASTISSCWKKLESVNDKMLRFLENHDEQRIASSKFLNNPFHAIPGMILAATFHNNPVMIYFGQEVGEPAKGKSGYSGDDGKTTIYDYWHVPEHQKWMNNGKFNENKLSKNQQKLRKFYSDLFNLCQKCDVFSRGAFYDLNWANKHSSYDHSKIYSYLRYTNKKRCLVVLNFDKKQKQSTTIFIPEDAFKYMQVELSSNLVINTLWGKELHQSKTSAQEILKDGIKIEFPPHSGAIFEINYRL